VAKPAYYAEVDPDNFAGVLFPSGICTPFGSPNCGLQNGFLNQGAALAKYGPLYTTPVSPAITAEPFNRRTAISNKASCSSSTSTLSVRCQERRGDGRLCRFPQRSHSGWPSQRKTSMTRTPARTAAIRARLHARCGFGIFPYAGYFQSVVSNNSIGSARYDGLLLKAETKSARHGLYALLGYTYSRNFDSGLPDGLGTNPGALYWPLPGTKRLDWGLSQLNLNNSFTASILYDLPLVRASASVATGWSGECRPRKLADQCDREGDFRIPTLRGRQHQPVGRGFLL